MTARPAGRVVAAGLLFVVAVLAHHTSSDSGTCWDRAPRCHTLVSLREAHDVGGLDQDRDLQGEAQAWAWSMARDGVLSHSGITYGAETVGMGPDTASILAGFMASPRHRAILLDPEMHRVGIGHAWAGDTLFLAVRWDY